MTEPQVITALWGRWEEENGQEILGHRARPRGAIWNRVIAAVLGVAGAVWLIWAAGGDWGSPDEAGTPMVSATPTWHVLPVPTWDLHATASAPVEPSVERSLPSTPIASGSAARPSSGAVSAAATSSVPSAAVTFTPISVQAEDPGNLFVGGATAMECASCEGGQRVGYIGAGAAVVVRMTLPASGPRTVTVIYESGGTRQIRMAANSTVVAVSSVTGPDWQTPQIVQFTVPLPAGPVELTFDGDLAPSPDIDRVTIG